MGNRERGIVDIDVDGQTYKLRFDANAMCELESRADMSMSEFLAKLDKAARDKTLRMSDVRLLMWAGLTEAHPDIEAKEVGTIINHVGGMNGAMELLGEAIQLAFPKAKNGGQSGAGKRIAAA